MNQSVAPPDRYLEVQIHGQIQRFPVGADRICRIGRADRNTLVLNSAQVSRDHALVDCPNGKDCVITDLGSVNGTTVNGMRLVAPKVLKDGDLICIGDFRILFREPTGDGAAPEESLDGTVVRIKNEEITVMVVDIRGYTPLSLKVGAEKLGEIMGHFIRESGLVLSSHGAWSQKYIGDAVMAIWLNDPSQPAAHFILNALRSVQRIREIANSLAVQFRLEEPIRIGAGINTGFASIGNLGSAANADHTALGDAVNKAFRLESATKEAGYDLMVGQSTLSHLEKKVSTAPFQLVQASLKGYDSPETCYGLSFGQLADFLALTASAEQP
jgi:adenylate cyclase